MHPTVAYQILDKPSDHYSLYIGEIGKYFSLTESLLLRIIHTLSERSRHATMDGDETYAKVSVKTLQTHYIPSIGSDAIKRALNSLVLSTVVIKRANIGNPHYRANAYRINYEALATALDPFTAMQSEPIRKHHEQFARERNSLLNRD